MVMDKCFPDNGCENEHVGPGEMLHAIKGFDLPQGLVCLLDGHWSSRAFDRNPHSSRHSLDDLYGYEYVCVESSSISELQPFPRHTGKSADSEWKWILYQQQASFSDTLSPVKSMDSFAHTVVGDLEPFLKADVRKASAELSFANVWSDEPKADELPHQAHAGIWKPHRVSMLQPLDARAAMPPTMSPTLSWHVKDVAAAIPQRCQVYAEDHHADFNSQFAEVVCHGYQGNHDLLPSANCWPWRETDAAENFGDLDECEAERKLSASTMSEKKSASDSTAPVCKLLSVVGEPHIIPTVLQELSVQEDRSLKLGDGDKTAANEASNEKSFNVKKQEDEILGEALCRAQTRARLAEELAAQALREREWLAHMLLREAWIACTYKRRAQALELENRLIKLHRSHAGMDVWTGRKSMSTYPPTQQKPSMPRPKLEQKHRPRQGTKVLCGRPTMWQSKDSRSWKHRVLLSCTLGLAFVLGLSIAGIGLMIGWSMGWMMYP